MALELLTGETKHGIPTLRPLNDLFCLSEGVDLDLYEFLKFHDFRQARIDSPSGVAHFRNVWELSGWVGEPQLGEAHRWNPRFMA